MMKIWHVGASPNFQKVDGLNATVWLVAREQSLFGHKVSILLNTLPDEATISSAKEFDIQILQIPGKRFLKISQYNPEILESLLKKDPPDVVHMHSIFLPKQALMAKTLIKHGIPYVITPHGITPQLLRRGWLKKSIYSWLVEKPRFYGAGAITAVTPGEESIIRTFVPHYQGIIREIPNPYFALGSFWNFNC